MAEVYQDKALMRGLEEKKPAAPDKPEVAVLLCAFLFFCEFKVIQTLNICACVVVGLC